LLILDSPLFRATTISGHIGPLRIVGDALGFGLFIERTRHVGSVEPLFVDAHESSKSPSGALHSSSIQEGDTAWLVAQAGMRGREGRDASAAARTFVASIGVLLSSYFLFFVFFIFSVYHFLRCMFIHAARGAYHPTAAGREKPRYPFRAYTQARATRVRPVGDPPSPTAGTARCHPPTAGRPWGGPDPPASAAPHPHRRSPPRATDLGGPRRGVGAAARRAQSTRTCLRGTKTTLPSPRRCLCIWRSGLPRFSHSHGRRRVRRGT